jgi:hypothetical protein
VLGDFIKAGGGGIDSFVELGVIYTELPRVDADNGSCFAFRNPNITLGADVRAYHITRASLSHAM